MNANKVTSNGDGGSLNGQLYIDDSYFISVQDGIHISDYDPILHGDPTSSGDFASVDGDKTYNMYDLKVVVNNAKFTNIIDHGIFIDSIKEEEGDVGVIVDLLVMDSTFIGTNGNALYDYEYGWQNDAIRVKTFPGGNIVVSKTLITKFYDGIDVDGHSLTNEFNGVTNVEIIDTKLIANKDENLEVSDVHNFKIKRVRSTFAGLPRTYRDEDDTRGDNLDMQLNGFEFESYQRDKLIA